MSESTPRRRISWYVRADRIDRERVLRGMTQRQLAAAAQVDQGTLTDLLSGRRTPNFGTLGALCTALGLQLTDVVAFADDAA